MPTIVIFYDIPQKLHVRLDASLHCSVQTGSVVIVVIASHHPLGNMETQSLPTALVPISEKVLLVYFCLMETIDSLGMSFQLPKN